jgi:hypothetical protein
MTVHRDGPTLQLRVELATFADVPPKRWDPGFNRVQVTLRFTELRAIELSGWGLDNVLSSWRIARDESQVTFSFCADQVLLSGRSSFLDIVNISGYMSL